MKIYPYIFVFSCCVVFSSVGTVSAQEQVLPVNQEVSPIQEESDEIKEVPNGIKSIPGKSAEELVRLAWAANSKSNLKEVQALVTECIDFYGEEAKLQQRELKNFPDRGREEDYNVLNNVATCLFIQAEAVMNQGMRDQAIQQFQYVIDTFPWAQAWDPRGWYWSISEKSQASIDVLTGKYEEDQKKKRKKTQRTKPVLNSPGVQGIIDYTKFGKFLNVGQESYHYSISDAVGLAKAVGEGIYPNTADIYKNPRYNKVRKEGRLKGSHWDFVNTDDLEAAYFKWVTAPEPWGVRLFYIGNVFEKAGMYYEALKAYHSLIVHYPKTISWTYWQTPWYPAQAAIAKIRYILRIHPELNLIDKWMKIEVINGYDNAIENDKIITYPGKIVEKGVFDKMKDSFQISKKGSLGKIKKVAVDGEKVKLVQYENNHWQILVDGRPFLIQGITYAPTRIGESPDKNTLKNWTTQDLNNNGLPDGPYDSWVDKNRNNKQDADEPNVGDLELMVEMGVNTLRIYHEPENPDIDFLRKMYQDHGLHVIMGDFLGKYAIGSGASWMEGTDYENPEHRRNMLESVKKMVLKYKDEPYILMWVLGNENNYGVASNADKKPEAFFKFVNEVAEWIKSVDPNHPVAVNNGDILFLDIFAKNSPAVDIFSANVYRGNYGFGSFWEQILDATGKPAFITEYGCPAYADHLTLEESEKEQSLYHQGNWMDIQSNSAGYVDGVGNSLGGVIFEWMDEWWKNYEPYMHDTKSDAVGPFPGGYYFEEWFGIVGQGNGRHSPFLRQLRESYYLYKRMWN